MKIVINFHGGCKTCHTHAYAISLCLCRSLRTPMQVLACLLFGWVLPHPDDLAQGKDTAQNRAHLPELHVLLTGKQVVDRFIVDLSSVPVGW